MRNGELEALVERGARVDAETDAAARLAAPLVHFGRYRESDVRLAVARAARRGRRSAAAAAAVIRR